MDFLSIAKNRYTTKRYNAEKKLPKQIVDELKEIILLSPSSINSQPWRFYFVEDSTLKEELAKVSYHNEEKIKEASLLVVFAALNDVKAFEEDIEVRLPAGSVAYYKQHLGGLPETEIQAWMKQQVYLSLGYFLSAAASLGIDSTPMEGIEKDKYNKLLQLNGCEALFAVALGYRDEEDRNQPVHTAKKRKNASDVITNL